MSLEEIRALDRGGPDEVDLPRTGSKVCAVRYIQRQEYTVARSTRKCDRAWGPLISQV